MRQNAAGGLAGSGLERQPRDHGRTFERGQAHGRTGVAHAFLGSVAEDLLHQAHCDVLVAKAW